MNWPQPLCDDCWDRENPDNPSPRLGALIPQERCYICGAPTRGAYVRRDLRTVPHPTESEAE